MSQVLTKIFGINYRTSILAVGVIVAAAGRVVLAYKAKDFTALANDGQLIMETAAALLAGLGLFIAKDAKVTGVGSQAKSVDSTGVVKNIEGDVVARQSVVPPQS
jgi:uncharacterized membrane-anchored protein